MLSLSDQTVGDPWFYIHNAVAHCYFLVSPRDAGSDPCWDIGHATSHDLQTWSIHELALHRGAAGAWDDVLATGSVHAWGGRYWMAYTGHRTAQTGLAVSDDLFHWQRAPGNPTTALDPDHYEAIGSGRRKMTHWRDPFLIEMDGEIFQIVCASRNCGSPDSRGALGLARSRDMVDWQVLPPLPVEPVVQELECPQVHLIEGSWYVVFSTGTTWFSDRALASYPPSLLGWTTYSMVADNWSGPYRLVETGRIVPPEFNIQPYAGQLIQWQGRWSLIGTVLDGDERYIGDPIPVKATPIGIKLDASRL